jgi:ABC-type spermidine/putrescine transport system permease subunit I
MARVGAGEHHADELGPRVEKSMTRPKTPSLDRRRPGFARQTAERLLVLPALLFVGIFLVYPFSLVVLETISSKDGFLEPYRKALADPFFRESVVRTLLICAAVSISALLVALPVAYEITRAERPRFHRAVMLAILVALWLSILVRSYAWLLLLQRTGAVNDLLLSIGVINEPLRLVRNKLGVYIGMTHILLPFMIVTLVPTFRNIPGRYIDAAASLGASRFYTFRRIVVPLASGGIIAGLLLTFILGLGFFITPQVLGDPSTVLVSQMIAQEIYHLRDIHEAAAMGILFTSLIVTLYVVSISLLKGPKNGEMRA